MLPKRHTPEPPQAGQGSAAAEADVTQEEPRHRRTGSGASSRSRPEASPCKPGKLVVSSKAKQYGKEFGAVKAEQEFGAVAAGTAGLLGTDEDDDFCPTCLEAYDDGNPKIFTRCGHHFHMPCIYEWLERKDTCPMCESKMVFEEDLLI